MAWRAYERYTPAYPTWPVALIAPCLSKPRRAMPPRESQSSLSRPLLSPEVQRVSSPVRKQKIQTEQSASDSESKFVQGANSELKVLKHRWSPLAITLFLPSPAWLPLKNHGLRPSMAWPTRGYWPKGAKPSSRGCSSGASALILAKRSSSIQRLGRPTVPSESAMTWRGSRPLDSHVRHPQLDTFYNRPFSWPGPLLSVIKYSALVNIRIYFIYLCVKVRSDKSPAPDPISGEVGPGP